MISQCKFYKDCKNTAVAIIPHSKLPLCKSHFKSYIEDRVLKTIKNFKLIDFSNPHEKILVGLSGGKDSQTLLTILNRILKDKVHLEALYIEVGITPKNYSKDSGIIARKLCEDLDIPFNILNIKEIVGFDIDDIHNLGKKMKRGRRRSKKGRFRGECSYCGLIKRYFLNKFAFDNQFTKMATGHNLTDEATQLISNFFNVDMELMSRAGPITMTDVVGLIPRIKPLFYIYEQELIMYSYYANVKHLGTQCKYAEDSPMMKIKASLLEIEGFRRGNMMNLVNSFQKKLKGILFDTIPDSKKIENQCNECGMGTYLEKCSFCKTKLRLYNAMEKKKIFSP